MNIAIINPADAAGIYQGLASKWAAIEPPIWARLLASYLRKKGHYVDILDAQLIPIEDCAHAVQDTDSHLCVIPVFGNQPSASTQTMPAAIRICEAVRRLSPGIPIIVMGTHPAALPEQTLRETGADAVCTGEGFHTIGMITEMIQEKGDRWGYFIRPDYPTGLCYWDHDEPVRTDPATNVINLVEEIPGGSWELLPMYSDSYRPHFWHSMGYPKSSKTRYASIYTTWGCPWKCVFCCINAPFAEGNRMAFGGHPINSYRRWSAQHVVDEIQALAENYNVTHIKISDEMFLLNERHVEAICDGLIERGLGSYLNFWFYTRVDTIKSSPALFDKMLQAGFRWAAIGIESSDPSALASADKQDYDEADTISAVERLRRAGMYVIANYIFGLPGDTWGSIGRTFELAISLCTEYVNLYSAVAFPGSRLFSEKIASGWKPPPWSAYSFHSYDHEPLGSENLTPRQVLAYRDEAMDLYLKDPGFHSQVLAKFGMQAKIDVIELSNVKLRRRLFES